MTDQQPPASSSTPGAPADWSAQPAPAPATEPPTVAPATPPPPAAKPPSKIRTYITFGVIAVIVAVLAFAISQNQSASDLAIGQCFDEPANDTGITTVVKHACTEGHDAEVFHVVEYTGGDAYPISLSLDGFIDDTCVPQFATYVGQPYESATEYNLGYFYPDREAWDDGDRTFTCYVSRADDAKLTQTVKSGASPS
jgi:Septum formation